jgi:polyadenylate-binding protein 2
VSRASSDLTALARCRHAYVEFAEASSVASALLMNDSLFKGRQIKVTVKRTNVPVWQLPRGGGGGGRGAPRGGGFRGRGGGAPRGFRGRGGRYRPY